MNIALICAYPASTNPGMISVDLSFEELLKSIKNLNFTKFCLEKKLGYTFLEDTSQLDNYDKIIYWGDFLHWLNYASNDWYLRIKKSNPDIDKDELIRKWYSLALLENDKHLQDKCITFGTSLYGINSLQLSNNRYFNSLKNFLINSELVLMRDFLSANLISQITGKQGLFGCDCAFLLETPNITKQDSNYIAYSFGRSGYSNELNIFAEKISKISKLPLVKIDWLKKGVSLTDLFDYIKIIKNASFTITDIYHFSITSWRENTPCLCIGKGSSYPRNTLSDKKKEILYMQMFALHNYCYVEKILENDDQYVKESFLNITNLNSNQLIFNFIKNQKDKSLDLLLKSLEK
jgi:hypothetical protein